MSTVELYRTGVGTINARKDFHKRRFAGAVFSDNSDDLTAPYIQRDRIQSHHAGKPLGYSRDLEQRLCVFCAVYACQLKPRIRLPTTCLRRHTERKYGSRPVFLTGLKDG